MDGNGNIHVIYADGVITNNGQSSPNGLFTVYEAVWNGSTWSTGNAIGPILNSFWYNLAIVTTSTQVQFFWVDWAGRVNVSSPTARQQLAQYPGQGPRMASGISLEFDSGMERNWKC